MATIAVQKPSPAAAAPTAARDWQPRLELLALVGVLCLAVLLRFPALDAGPPALADDEAINGLDIYRIFNGYREPFLPNNNGREALFIYVQAASVALFGASAWSLRIVSALAGLGGVLATWAMGRALFGRWVGIFSAGILATLLWNVILSRVGLRASSSPLILALSIWLFWRVLARGRLRDGAWLGVVMGIGLQTYLSTRLIPLILLIVFAIEIIRNPWLLGARLKPLLLGTVIAVGLLAPLGWYYLRYPEDALTRQTQVVIGSDNPQGDTRYSTVADSIPRTLLMFNLHGDENWRHNIAGRPAFDPLTGALFGLGLGVAVVLVGRATSGEIVDGTAKRGRDDSAARTPMLHPHAWLLVAFPILLLPGFVTIESPHFLRTMIVLPVLTTFPALAIVHGGRWLIDRARLAGLPARRLALGAAALGAIYLLGSGVLTYRLYWHEWAPSIATWQAFTGSANPLLAWLRQYEANGGDLASVQLSLPPMPPINQPPAEIGYSMLLDPFFPPLPSIPFLMPQVDRVLRLDLATTILPLHGPRDRDQVHIAAGPERFDLPAAYFPEAQVIERPPGPDGWPAYIRVDVPAAAINTRLGAMQSLDADYGPVRLIGALVTGGPSLPAGEVVTVDLRWRVVEPGEINYGPGAVLIGPAGTRWADDDRQGAALGGWQPGDEFLSRHRLTIPRDAPPGQYRIEAAMSRRSLFPQPSQIIRSLGRATPVGEIAVAAPATPGEAPPPIGAPDGRALVPGLTLEQVAPLPREARPGDEIAAIVRWRIGGELPATTLQLVQGERVIATAPVIPAYQGERWLRSRYPVRVPATATAGDGTLRLVALRPDGSTAAAVDLGTIQIDARERSFTPQPTAVSTAVQFGDDLALAGWSVDQQCDERRVVDLTAQWQARREMATRYTVFVHVLGPGGAIVAQQDSQPRRGEYPTTAWQAGEYVVDRIEIAVPPDAGTQPLRVIAGWYDALSGQRLPVSSGGDFAVLAERLPGC